MTGNGARSGSHPVGLATIVALLVLCGLVGCGRAPQVLKSGRCKPGDPLAGVYLPSRLAVKNACTTVSGIVDCLQHEPDGDVHIRLRPDPDYRRLLTPVGHQPFKDNSATRAGFLTPDTPIAGEHVMVTGPLVWDTNLLHDLVYPGRNVRDWAEIHPAWNITANASPARTA
jgi:hypothetical protein